MTRKKFVVFSLLVGLTLTGPLVSGAGAKNSNPGVAPSQAKPHGKTYGEWAAEWWQWALEAPASINPIVDTTGEHCTAGQTGQVWFLAGTFGTSDVERTCTVPKGTALFFPLINAFSGAFLNDPEELRTVEYNRKQVMCHDVVISAEIDGVPVNNPLQYFEQSPIFEVQFPKDNIFELTEEDAKDLLLSPTVDAGYYLFLHPLRPGTHTLHWVASQTCPFGEFAQEVTYHLTVR